MAKVTIGVPVYNGSAYLEAALENLRTQSCGDLKVLIYDNASTDDTSVIAARFVDLDRRFHYFKQSSNRGALSNFIDVLSAADTEYFMWRAMDDGSDSDYVETLLGLLEAQPQCDLAVGKIVTFDLDGRKLREAPFPKLNGDRGLPDKVRLLFESHPSWIYGLFRREPLLQRARYVQQHYGHPWAWDHLTLLPYLLDFKVAGTNGTACRQVLRRTASSKLREAKKVHSVATLAQLRQRFFAIARNDVRSRASDPVSRAIDQVLLWMYVGKRVYRWRRLWKRRIVDAVLMKPKENPNEKAGFESYF